jgi:hypothetical protein
VERPGAAATRDAAFIRTSNGSTASLAPDWASPAARVASEFLLAAAFAAGVTQPWWTGGLPERKPAAVGGRRPAEEV